MDPEGIPQFGLVAEAVEKVNPDLVARDEQGKPYTVRYEAVNAMLLNEFLKQHRKVEQQESTIAQLKSALVQQQKQSRLTASQQQKEIEDLKVALKAQASQIQKVSEQLAAASPSFGGLEVSKFATGRIRRGGPSPQIALNNQ
jgi:septal ring factor EnvC (AmiA/AmiB activator)